jgi:hypothetical protein
MDGVVLEVLDNLPIDDDDIGENEEEDDAEEGDGNIEDAPTFTSSNSRPCCRC